MWMTRGMGSADCVTRYRSIQPSSCSVPAPVASYATSSLPSASVICVRFLNVPPDRVEILSNSLPRICMTRRAGLSAEMICFDLSQ